MLDRAIGCFGAALLLAACAADQERRTAALLPEAAQPAAFTTCHGHGCAYRTPIALEATDWARIRSIMLPPARSPDEERRRVAAAIARIEVMVGRQAGTLADLPRNDIWADRAQQLDCVDEAVNTTTYLRLLAADGLLRWHTVSLPASRADLPVQLPHNTAVLRDETTGRLYAVDSWFFANGVPPVILPLTAWRAGWEPEDGPIEASILPSG